MPDPATGLAQRRLALWRRGIHLFDKTRRDEGPFHAAGYRDYVLEPRLSNGTTPDILGSSQVRFVTCDLSVSPHKDAASLKKHRGASLTAALKLRLGGDVERVAGAGPFLITPSDNLRDVPVDVNILQLTTPPTKQLPDVEDEDLRTCLYKWTGFAHPPPSYSILALPESDVPEIKQALGGILLQRASVGEPLAALDATKALLGDLWDAFPAAPRKHLENKVQPLLEQAGAQLQGFAKWDRQQRRLVVARVDGFQSMQAFRRKLAAWLGTTLLTQYEEAPDPDDGSGDEDEDDEQDEEN